MNYPTCLMFVRVRESLPTNVTVQRVTPTGRTSEPGWEETRSGSRNISRRSSRGSNTRTISHWRGDLCEVSGQ